MLIKRMLMLFFRDWANVFFSLLAVLIIIGLYVLFLGHSLEQSLRAALGFDANQIGLVVASVTLAGMIAVASVTSCLGALGVSIADKQNAAKDFFTSPVARWKITLGYVLGSAVVGLVMTLIALILCVTYITAKGGALPGAADCGRLLLTVILSVLCGNGMMFFVALLIKSQSAFAALSTVTGTLIGFLMGIYIPVGSLPQGVQWVIKCFPPAHGASMFKQVLADSQMSQLLAGAPPETLVKFRETFGVVFAYGGYVSNFWFSALILAATAVLFYGLSAVIMQTRRT